MAGNFEFCKKCNKNSIESYATCEICHSKFHLKCIIPNVQTASVESVLKTPGFHFYCDDHRHFNPTKLLEKISYLKDKIIQLGQPLLDIAHELEDYKNEVADCVSARGVIRKSTHIVDDCPTKRARRADSMSVDVKTEEDHNSHRLLSKSPTRDSLIDVEVDSQNGFPINTDLWNTLSEIDEDNVEDVYTVFNGQNIKIKQIHLLTKEDLYQLFPKSELGVMVEFREKLLDWQKKSNDPSDTTTTRKSKFSLRTLVESEPFLKSKIGRHTLSNRETTIMLELIIKHFLEMKWKMEYSDMEQISEDIETIFHKEKKETYYKRVEKVVGGKLFKSVAAGKLVYKWNNRKSMKFFAAGRDREREDECPEQAEQEDGRPPLTDEEAEELRIEFLRKHSTDRSLTLTLEYWDQTFPYRMKQIRDEDDGAEGYLKDWPIVKGTDGMALISQDFSQKYPNVKQTLLPRWGGIKQVLKNYMKTQFGETKMRRKKTLVHEDADSTYVLYMLPSILRPTHQRKLTTTDAQDLFIKYFETYSEFEMAEIMTTPYLAVVLDAAKANFYVKFIDTFYVSNNVIEALELTFKIFWVFDLQYPESTFNTWKFFEQGFYEGLPTSKKHSPTVDKLLGLIESDD